MPHPITAIPQIPIPQPPDADPYAVLKSFRATAPLARAEMGLVLGLRQRHLDPIMGEATRQLETETKLMQGITSGPLFEFT